MKKKQQTLIIIYHMRNPFVAVNGFKATALYDAASRYTLREKIPTEKLTEASGLDEDIDLSSVEVEYCDYVGTRGWTNKEDLVKRAIAIWLSTKEDSMDKLSADFHVADMRVAKVKLGRCAYLYLSKVVYRREGSKFDTPSVPIFITDFSVYDLQNPFTSGFQHEKHVGREDVIASLDLVTPKLMSHQRNAVLEISELDEAFARDGVLTIETFMRMQVSQPSRYYFLLDEHTMFIMYWSLKHPVSAAVLPRHFPAADIPGLVAPSAPVHHLYHDTGTGKTLTALSLVKSGQLVSSPIDAPTEPYHVVFDSTDIEEMPTVIRSKPVAHYASDLDKNTAAAKTILTGDSQFDRQHVALPSDSTLVIVPAGLKDQWVDAIEAQGIPYAVIHSSSTFDRVPDLSSLATMAGDGVLLVTTSVVQSSIRLFSRKSRKASVCKVPWKIRSIEISDLVGCTNTFKVKGEVFFLPSFEFAPGNDFRDAISLLFRMRQMWTKLREDVFLYAVVYGESFRITVDNEGEVVVNRETVDLDQGGMRYFSDCSVDLEVDRSAKYGFGESEIKKPINADAFSCIAWRRMIVDEAHLHFKRGGSNIPTAQWRVDITQRNPSNGTIIMSGQEERMDKTITDWMSRSLAKSIVLMSGTPIDQIGDRERLRISWLRSRTRAYGLGYNILSSYVCANPSGINWPTYAKVYKQDYNELLCRVPLHIRQVDTSASIKNTELARRVYEKLTFTTSEHERLLLLSVYRALHSIDSVRVSRAVPIAEQLLLTSELSDESCDFKFSFSESVTVSELPHTAGGECAITMQDWNTIFEGNDKVGLMECGHAFSASCAIAWGRRCPGSIFCCPLCRTSIPNWLSTTKEVVASSKRVIEADYHDDAHATNDTRLELITANVLDYLGRGKKVLLFTETNKEADLMRHALMARGANPFEFTTSIPVKRRRSNLKKFRTATESNVLVTTFLACSTGLNIIEASVVMFAGMPANMATAHQAVHRVRRIGQVEECHLCYLADSETSEAEEWMKLLATCQY